MKNIIAYRGVHLGLKQYNNTDESIELAKATGCGVFLDIWLNNKANGFTNMINHNSPRRRMSVKELKMIKNTKYLWLKNTVRIEEMLNLLEKRKILNDNTFILIDDLFGFDDKFIKKYKKYLLIKIDCKGGYEQVINSKFNNVIINNLDGFLNNDILKKINKTFQHILLMDNTIHSANPLPDTFYQKALSYKNINVCTNKPELYI